MKWIGQHIYDLASRFRNDVFLEDISTGTIASGAHLGLDSNNKIVKADDGGGDLTSIVAGTGLSGTSLTGPIPTLNVDATQPNIDSIGTDGDTLAILSDQLVMSNATAQMPTIKLTNTANDGTVGELIFEKLRADDGVAQGQNLGVVRFRGEDANQNTEDYAYIIGEIDVSTHGQESGQLVLGVANHDGGNGNGLIITGGSADDEIDVTVGLGAASVTTVSGTLTMGSTAAIDNSGAWVGGVIPSAKLDTDTAHLSGTQTFTGTKTLRKGIILDGDYAAANATDGAAIHVDAQDITDSTTSASGTTATFKHVSIETPRLLATNSSVTTTDAATLYIKGAPLAHTNQTITNAYALWVDSGNVKFDEDLIVVGNIDLEGDTITSAADLNIVATGNDISIDTDHLTVFSAATADPTLTLKSTTNNNVGSTLEFISDKGGAGADNDIIGSIKFIGDDTAQVQTQFARIVGSVSESADTDEAGKLEFFVAESNGTATNSNTVGLLIEGEHATDGQIDVTIAAGAASTTTIAGTLTVGSTAAIDNSGVWVGGVIPSAKLDADTAHLSGAQTFTGTKTLNSFKGTAGATVTNILDEDAMGSDSATALATQQSIKAYADRPDSQVQVSWHGFTDDIDTTKQYIGLLDADSENTATSNGDLPLVAPVAGKLLQVSLRTNQNLSGKTLTWRLETQATGVSAGTGPTVVGTQSGAGSTNSSVVTYDFTTGLDSGDNIIDAGDLAFLSVQSDGTTGNTKYYITCLWEWDLSGI